MDNQNEMDLERIVFVGETLGPLYLHDPQIGLAAELLAAFASLDVAAAAAEWPFVAADVAEQALSLMAAGAVGAIGVADDADGANIIREALTWEYRRLFVGPGIKAAAPWGSVYTDRECVVFGASTLALRRWMRERGITRLDAGAEAGRVSHDPEDHIGLMLLLMSWIADHKPELLDEYLRLHMLTWAGHFADKLAASAEHPFYKGLARLTKASLEGVQKARRIEVVLPKFYC